MSMSWKHTSRFLSAALAMSLCVSAVGFSASAATTQDATVNGTAAGTYATTGATLQTGAKASMTIYKYDMTSAEEDGLTTTTTTNATGDTIITINQDANEDGAAAKTSTITNEGGAKIQAVNDAYADYAIKGVQFTTAKIAEICTYNKTQVTTDSAGKKSDGSGKVLNVYAIKKTDKILEILGLSEKDAVTNTVEDYSDLTCGTTAITASNFNDYLYFTSDTIQTALNDTYDADNTQAKDALEKYLKGTDELKDVAITTGTAITMVKQTRSAAIVMPDTDENGMTTLTGQDLGLYLVVETEVPEEVTSTVKPFLASLPMTTQNGDEWNYDLTLYPKNETGEPTLEKLIAEASTSTGWREAKDADGTAMANHTYVTKADATASDGTGSDAQTWGVDYETTASGSTGDVVNFVIESKLAPISSEATYLTEYTITDTMSQGLTNNNDVKLYWYANETDMRADEAAETLGANAETTWEYNKSTGEFGKGYAVMDTADSSQEKTCVGLNATVMTITMTEAGLAEINGTSNTDADINNQIAKDAGMGHNYGQHYLLIAYTATVNSDASVVYGDMGNDNDVKLTWARTSDGYSDELRDECIFYTYGMNPVKQFSDGNGVMSDVTFSLKNNTDNYFVVAEERDAANGLYYVTGRTTDESKATKFTPAETTGEIQILGLEDDTYIFTELTTASGYTLLKDNIAIDINFTATSYNMAQNGTQEGIRTADSSKDLNSDPLAVNDTTYTGVQDTYDDNDADSQAYADDTNRAAAAYNNWLVYTVNETRVASTTVAGNPVTMENNNSTVEPTATAAVTHAIPGTAVSWSYNANTVDSGNAIVPLTIVNNHGFELPKTGGNGTTIVCLGGFALAAAAVGAAVIWKKKSSGTAAS